MKTSDISASITLVILFFGLAQATRTKFFSVKSQNVTTKFAPEATDGICSSMVETRGYTCEEHTVTTQDGYILSMQRIPVGQSGGTPGNRPPVLLQHGLLMDGITWLLLPPEQSLAFLLADTGFDVWLANTRGTKYSRQHTSLSPGDPAYWNWSWDELVKYDLPATIQYVHDLTGQKLHYVGHSLGTLIALASFSKDQLLNLLRSAALLSPIAYAGQMTSPLARNAAENYVAEGLSKIGIYEFDPTGQGVIKVLKSICGKPGVDCTNLLTAFTGKNCCLDPSIVNVFLEHEPQSTATKNMIHLSQMIREGTITMYDYKDEDANREHYGQPTPPIYNMTSIPSDFPLFLSYGGADALSDVKDVKLLLGSLKDHEGDKLVVQYRDDYAHADYVMAENAKQDVYDPLMAFFKLQ
ncbi:Lipase [Quillaja saponaria]|uniref:Lipase n=1 Tax=Quillaja saponaria TaxID=32244 RepID=A0AAD7LLH8_QUISA|nr:Lipase [Quillaja saponaria]